MTSDRGLPCTPDQRVTLSELRGGPATPAFHPADRSPVGGDQVALYQAVQPAELEHAVDEAAADAGR